MQHLPRNDKIRESKNQTKNKTTHKAPFCMYCPRGTSEARKTQERTHANRQTLILPREGEYQGRYVCDHFFSTISTKQLLAMDDVLVAILKANGRLCCHPRCTFVRNVCCHFLMCAQTSFHFFYFPVRFKSARSNQSISLFISRTYRIQVYTF